MSSSARQSGVCDQCGRGLTILFAQDATNGALRWSWSAPCTGCGKNTGHDGTGRTPGEIRAAVLGAEGEWTVAPRDPSSVAIPAIKALRAVYALGLKEAKDQWEATGLRGTRAECEAFAWQLRQDSIESDILFAGAASVVAPLPPTPPAAPAPDEGDWCVTIRDGASLAITVIKAIRSAFKLGLKESKDVWDHRAAGDAIRGSQEQCEALAAQLRTEGVIFEMRVFSAPVAAPQPREVRPVEPGWSITLRGVSGVSISGIKAIRATFKLGLKEAKDLWDAGVKSGVIKGTRFQCEELSKQFVLEKVPHEVKAAPR